MTIDQSIYDILIFHQLPYTKHYVQQSIIQLFYPNNQIIIRNKKHKPINLIIINSSSFFIRNRLHTFHHYNCKINNIIITKMTTLNYIQFQPRSKPKKKKKENQPRYSRHFPSVSTGYPVSHNFSRRGRVYFASKRQITSRFSLLSPRRRVFQPVSYEYTIRHDRPRAVPIHLQQRLNFVKKHVCENLRTPSYLTSSSIDAASVSRHWGSLVVVIRTVITN